MYVAVLLPFLLLNLPHVTLEQIESEVSITYYYGLDESERGLPICQMEVMQACSAVFPRYWLPPILVRLCRCPRRYECPTNLEKDDQAIMIDNRSQLKYCQPVAEKLNECRPHERALTIEASHPHLKYYEFEEWHRLGIQSTPPRITLHCNCLWPYYWQQTNNSFNSLVDIIKTISVKETFECAPLKICDSGAFCGYSRNDTNSTYYRCSCPVGHLCIHSGSETDTEVVSEMLYDGHARKSFCVKHNTYENHL